VGEAELRPQQQDDDRQQQDNSILVKSYLYTRLAIVALLVALGVSVFLQTLRQGLHPLTSVSAYYYTPAQTIFVGALIGFAACMIALKGTTNREDVFLNIGGMLAAVVAIVPTSRGADFDAAVAACQKAGRSLTGGSTEGSDCPTTVALVEAAKANISNNMWTLLIVGVLVALVTLPVALKSRQPFSWAAFYAGVAVLLAGLLAFAFSGDWFVRNAHWLAAVGLFACIFVVALENARREKSEKSGGSADVEQAVGQPVDQAARMLVQRTVHRNHYIWIARVMLGVGAFTAWAWLQSWITLFWLEVIVFLLFIAFWVTQTFEQGNKLPGAEHYRDVAKTGD
jgi:hypothetical protein